MDELSILSPHRDDAVFSTYFALMRWAKTGVKLRVVNCFTQSQYAPRLVLEPSSLPLTTATISAVRGLEDRRVIKMIDPSIVLESLDLIDAPLRLGAKVDDLCSAETAALRHPDENATIAALFRKYFRRGLVLAPLALGGHVDHLAVRDAALVDRRHHRLGFYEDLPYASRVSEEALRQRVQEIEGQTGVTLKPIIVKTPDSKSDKFRASAGYQSQISREEARAIARYADKYGGGERLWVPGNNRLWTAVIEG